MYTNKNKQINLFTKHNNIILLVGVTRGKFKCYLYCFMLHT